jgi:BlaI family penicillinase repressor
MEIRSLTKAEAEIMKILWQLKKGFIKDILAKMDDPKPAYTTVATFVKILEKNRSFPTLPMATHTSFSR